jgi:hypothetical protein
LASSSAIASAEALKNVLPVVALFRGQDIQAAGTKVFGAALRESSLCSFLFKEKAEKS